MGSQVTGTAGPMTSEALFVLRRREGFPEAVQRLRAALSVRHDQVAAAAVGYGKRFEGDRAAMVVDVITSRQRRYETRVRDMVEAFRSRAGRLGLEQLACATFISEGLRRGEQETIVGVAAGLRRFGSDNGIADDDSICAAWATATGPLVLCHRLDPYVGVVKGVGPALFCYLRMRSGGDGLKPDLRVRRAFVELGLNPPTGEAALLVLAQALADELDIGLLELDQLLWWSRPGELQTADVDASQSDDVGS